MSTDTLYRWILGSVFLSLGFSLQASSLTIGEPPLVATGNCDPFGCPVFFGLGTYQQVYASSAFAGESTITGLTFYNTQVTDGGNPAAGAYDLSLSYSNHNPGDLDITNPNDNISSDSQSFFSGSLPPVFQNTLDFMGTPFDYNPADGNLLLTITVTDASDRLPTLYLDEASQTTQTSDAYFGTVNGGNTTGGLVTGFTVVSGVVATPEPGSLLFMLGGISLIAYRRRRHRLL